MLFLTYFLVVKDFCRSFFFDFVVTSATRDITI